MILQAVEEIADQYHYEGGLKVDDLCAGRGEDSQKDLQSPSGNRGGISILGTSVS